jgi:zinc/manganese transport system substrate-binding protein
MKKAEISLLQILRYRNTLAFMKTSLLTLLSVSISLWPALAKADLAVATLHPMLSDLATQVGGAEVKLLEMVKPGMDPHEFSPKPEDLKSLQGVKLVLASGKHLENYLEKLQGNLTDSQALIDLGAKVPDLTEKQADALQLEPEEEEAGHDHKADEHHHHGADPHWWNSVENMQRAAGLVAEAFSKADPTHAEVYRKNAKAYVSKLDELKKWAKKELSAIPLANRKLASAHDSLGYFAQEFGFKLLAIQGVSPTVKATSQEIAEAIGKIKKHKIRAIFPEQGVNPKQLEEILRETGAKQGGELIADGNGTGECSTFEKAFRHNIQLMVEALR